MTKPGSLWLLNAYTKDNLSTAWQPLSCCSVVSRIPQNSYEVDHLLISRFEQDVLFVPVKNDPPGKSIYTKQGTSLSKQYIPDRVPV